MYPNLTYVEGAARLAERGVWVNRSLVQTAKIVIANGARPAAPPIPGHEQVPWLSSTKALELSRRPRSLLVIGGGYIGCEIA